MIYENKNKPYSGFQLVGLVSEFNAGKIGNMTLYRGGSFNKYTLGGSIPARYTDEFTGKLKKDGIEYKIF